MPTHGRGSSRSPRPAPAGADPFSELERGAWAGLLTLQGRFLRRVEADLERNSDLTHPEFEVLLRLSWSENDRSRIQDLAEQSLLTRSGMSRVVQRLESKGLVTRSRAEEDGRGAYAELTAAGADRFAGAVEHHVAFVRRELLSRYSADELRTLGALLARGNAASDTGVERPPTPPARATR